MTPMRLRDVLHLRRLLLNLPGCAVKSRSTVHDFAVSVQKSSYRKVCSEGKASMQSQLSLSKSCICYLKLYL